MSDIAAYGSGNWLGLPEFGLTEKFGGKTQSLTDAQFNSNAGSAQRVSNTPSNPGYYGMSVGQPSVAGSNTSNVPQQSTANQSPLQTSGDSGGSSSSGGGSSSSGGGFDASDYASSLGYDSTGAAKDALGVSSLEEYYKQYGDRAAQQRELQRKQAEQIGKAWDPIMAELDRQLGSIPSRQSGYEGRIGSLAEAQISDVEKSRETSTESLESERARGLRELEEDIRNQLEAAGRTIGVAGAGSSSAVGQASEAITRVGQKARGNLQESIAQRLTDINNLASTQRSQINQWKGDKLFEITQFFGNKLDELSMQRANSQKDRKEAVEKLIFDAEKDYFSALKDLDSTVISYAQSVDLWERERAAQLEDYAKKVSTASQYDINDALGLFNSLIQNGLNAEDARAEVENSYGILLPAGVQGEKTAPSPNDLFGEGTLYIDSGAVGTGVGTDPFSGLFDDL